MGTSKLFSKNKLNPVRGAIVEIESIKKWEAVTKTMPLKDLVALKLKTVERIKSLSNFLLSNKSLSLKIVQENIEKLEGLQYNLTVFKQLNAIANVGNPDENMFGINACIFQSGDLNSLNSLMFSLVTKTLQSPKRDSEDFAHLREFLRNKTDSNKRIVDGHYRIQQEYNARIKVTVEYLNIP